jgi:hypothetical protein
LPQRKGESLDIGAPDNECDKTVGIISEAGK